MVLENILSPDNAESRPWLLFGIGFAYVSLALFLAYFIFKAYSSLFMVFLATIAVVPIIYKIMKLEEEKDLTDIDEQTLLKEHGKALSAFMFLFFGATIAFALWFVVLPADTLSIVYESQSATISSINAPPAKIASATGAVTGDAVNAFGVFNKIFFNNIKVLLFCILFSFLYGAGAIFILLWNASVLGTAMGSFVRSSLSTLAQSACGPTAATSFCAVAIGLLKYTIHGIPEILAYFIAALAGGIISIAVINHEFTSQKFEHIILDSADLIIISIVIIFVAALLEVFVTPAIKFDTDIYQRCIGLFICTAG